MEIIVDVAKPFGSHHLGGKGFEVLVVLKHTVVIQYTPYAEPMVLAGNKFQHIGYLSLQILHVDVFAVFYFVENLVGKGFRNAFGMFQIVDFLLDDVPFYGG